MTKNNKKIGGHLLADQLSANGVDTIFCVPGESYLGLMDGLYNHKEKIKLITTRHESGAANMADAYAKLTNKPGICIVSSCLLYTSPSPRDATLSRMPSSA